MSWYLNAQLGGTYQCSRCFGLISTAWGVLIQGDSGIGKSETALELVKRGHRLVADDRVDVYAKDEGNSLG